jgi:ribosomal protein L15
MNGANRSGRGNGGGQGMGGGRGRKGGPLAGGAGGACRCPNCGHTQPHERGVPCTQVQCPKCKTSMVRE